MAYGESMGIRKQLTKENMMTESEKAYRHRERMRSGCNPNRIYPKITNSSRYNDIYCNDLALRGEHFVDTMSFLSHVYVSADGEIFRLK